MRTRKALYESIMQSIRKELCEMLIVEMAHPSLFKDYADIDIFTEDYYIVQNESGKYNLADRNGKLVSNVWFETIEKRGDGLKMVPVSPKENKVPSEIVISKKDINTSTMANISDAVSSKTPIPAILRDVALVYFQPYVLPNSSNGQEITIIASAKIKGKTILLSSDGKCYTLDGKEVSYSEGFDANTLKKIKAVDDMCKYIYDCMEELFPLTIPDAGHAGIIGMDIYEIPDNKAKASIDNEILASSSYHGDSLMFDLDVFRQMLDGTYEWSQDMKTMCLVERAYLSVDPHAWGSTPLYKRFQAFADKVWNAYCKSVKIEDADSSEPSIDINDFNDRRFLKIFDKCYAEEKANYVRMIIPDSLAGEDLIFSDRSFSPYDSDVTSDMITIPKTMQDPHIYVHITSEYDRNIFDRFFNMDSLILNWSLTTETKDLFCDIDEIIEALEESSPEIDVDYVSPIRELKENGAKYVTISPYYKIHDKVGSKRFIYDCRNAECRLEGINSDLNDFARMLTCINGNGWTLYSEDTLWHIMDIDNELFIYECKDGKTFKKIN